MPITSISSSVIFSRRERISVGISLCPSSMNVVGFFKFDLSLLFIAILALSSLSCVLENLIDNIFNGLSHFLKNPYLSTVSFSGWDQEAKLHNFCMSLSGSCVSTLQNPHALQAQQVQYARMTGALACSSAAGLTSQTRIYYTKSCIHHPISIGKPSSSYVSAVMILVTLISWILLVK